MHRATGGARRGLTRALALVALLLAPAACDALDNALEVEAPSRIPASELESPQHAQLLLNGAIADFECAAGAFVVMGGMLTDELMDATQTANRWPYDKRDVRPDDARYASFGCTAWGVYTPLSTARWAADNILARLEEWSDSEVPQRTQKIATAAAYSGYSHLLLGEAFCSAAVDQGPELSSAQLFELAVGKFTRAIEAARAAGDQKALNLALVGRARAYLDLGRTTEALADARAVEPGFEAFASASDQPSRRKNRVYAENNPNDGFSSSVAPEYRSLEWQGVADPRVRVEDTGRDATDGTRIFVQTKYTAASSPIRIASWDEAQLIIAEIEGGQTAVGIINMFHERAGLPAFVSLSEAEIRQHVIQERSRELFLEGQHLYDVRRLSLPLSPAVGEPFAKGGTYGSTTCLPLPDVERHNNPNIP